MVSESQPKNPAKIEFHPDWQGEIPPFRDSSEIEKRALRIAERYGELSPGEYEKLCNYLREFDLRFFEAAANNDSPQLYHRPCRGGTVRKVGAGLFCSKCKDKMEEVIPPNFLV